MDLAGRRVHGSVLALVGVLQHTAPRLLRRLLHIVSAGLCVRHGGMRPTPPTPPTPPPLAAALGPMTGAESIGGGRSCAWVWGKACVVRPSRWASALRLTQTYTSHAPSPRSRDARQAHISGRAARASSDRGRQGCRDSALLLVAYASPISIPTMPKPQGVESACLVRTTAAAEAQDAAEGIDGEAVGTGSLGWVWICECL